MAIEEVSGENIYSYDYDSLNYDIDVSLELEGYTKDMPEFTVTVPEGSSYEIKTDSESGNVSIVVTAPNGCYRIYHVSYQMSSAVYRIDSVTGTGIETDWEIEGVYDEETDELLYRELYVNGTEETLPDDFSVIAGYNQAKVEIKDSDREGYEKMVIISHEDISRVYYVVYRISSIVYTIGEVSGTGMDSEGWIRWIYDDETDEVLYKEFCVFGLQEKLPEDFAVEAAYEGSTAVVKDSDREGYEKMVVVSYKNTNQVYYVSYEISSAAYEVGQVNGTGIDGWQMSWGYDEYTDEEYNVLYVYGTEENLPEDFAVTAACDTSTVEISGSDREGYEKTVVISYMGEESVYYVSYKISSAVYDINEISGTGIGGWWINLDYDEDTDEEYYVLCVYGTEENLPEDFVVIPPYQESTAEIKDSDREGYEKMVQISYRGNSKFYYISYEQETAEG